MRRSRAPLVRASIPLGARPSESDARGGRPDGAPRWARARGDIEGMMRHSADFLSLVAIVVVAWLWLWQATLAKEALLRGTDDGDFYEGKVCAAQYWIATELPRAMSLAKLCRSGEDSYARMRDAWF